MNELMNIVLDIRSLLWAFLDTPRIEKRRMDIILSEDNEIFYSQASLWEISIKTAFFDVALLQTTNASHSTSCK